MRESKALVRGLLQELKKLQQGQQHCISGAFADADERA